MSTAINITVDDGGLPARNRQQVAANRQALVQKIATEKSTALGVDKRSQERIAQGRDPATGALLIPPASTGALGASGGGIPRLNQQPAANRQSSNIYTWDANIDTTPIEEFSSPGTFWLFNGQVKLYKNTFTPWSGGVFAWESPSPGDSYILPYRFASYNNRTTLEGGCPPGPSFVVSPLITGVSVSSSNNGQISGLNNAFAPVSPTKNVKEFNLSAYAYLDPFDGIQSIKQIEIIIEFSNTDFRINYRTDTNLVLGTETNLEIVIEGSQATIIASSAPNLAGGWYLVKFEIISNGVFNYYLNGDNIFTGVIPSWTSTYLGYPLSYDLTAAYLIVTEGTRYSSSRSAAVSGSKITFRT